MVALPADHPLAGDDTLALSQLRGQPRVGWARAGAPDYHDRITALLRREGVDPTPAYELRGVDTRLGAVASGLGWALESAARLRPARVTAVQPIGEQLKNGGSRPLGLKRRAVWGSMLNGYRKSMEQAKIGIGHS